jgi:hypothetical protein
VLRHDSKKDSKKRGPKIVNGYIVSLEMKKQIELTPKSMMKK